MAITFEKAARHAVKHKIGIDGPSGSGKTLGALALAHGITKGGKIAVADSENGSASLYADRYEFDTVRISDAKPATYMATIDAAVGAGYDALVLDSITHGWQYVLNQKEAYDRANPKANQWTSWGRFAPQWDALMQHILQAPIHIIATMRSKQAYEQVERDGKKQVVKLGLQPQVRDGAEYEFGIVFSVTIAHKAEATKDRTALFADRVVDLCDPAIHGELVAWMNAGGPAPEPKVREPEEYKVNGQPMSSLTDEELERYIESRAGESRYVARVTAAQQMLAARLDAVTDDQKVAQMVSAVETEGALLPFAKPQTN